MNDFLKKKNLDIVNKKIEEIKDVSVNKKRVSVKRDPNVRIQKSVPDSIPVRTTDIMPGMRLGCVVFNNNQILMEVETELDDKKIDFLKEKTDLVYIIEDKQAEEIEQKTEERIDIQPLLLSNDFKQINNLIQKNALKFDDFEKIFDYVKNIPENPDVDKIFNTVLQYYDLNIREKILDSISSYNSQKYYTELFRVIIDFDIEDINEHKKTFSDINRFFLEKNTTFFKILASYFDVMDDEKKEFVFQLLKKLDKEKLKKLLIVYSNDNELKDIAYQLLNIMKNDFIIADKKSVKNDIVETKDNEISFKTILKEIEERKNRKERIISEITKINIASEKNSTDTRKKKPALLKAGDVIINAFYREENLVFPADTILTDENIAYIRKFTREELEVYNMDDLYEFFCSVTENIEDKLEKLDLFIYLLELRDGKNELDTLSIIINFPDRDLKIAALKYMITNMSPKRFAYIIAAMRQDIPELNEMLKASFEQKKDLFSFKLFLKVASDENNSLIEKKIREFVKKSDELMDMVRIIIRTAPANLKKLCFDILG